MTFTKNIISMSIVLGSMLAVSPVIAVKAGSAHVAHKHKVSKKSQAVGNQIADDQIVAIVNNDVITTADLNQRLAALHLSGTNMTDKQALEAMIDERMLNSYANDIGIKVTDDKVKHALETIASQNGVTIEQMHKDSKKYNIVWEDYIENLRQQIKLDELRSAIVSQRLSVTPDDVAAFLKQHPTGTLHSSQALSPAKPKFEKREVVVQNFIPKAVAFQHIFVRVANPSSEADVAAAKKKMSEAIAKLRKGVSFADVAREYSEGPEASKGGDLGMKLNENWPALFMQATKNVPDGRISGVITAENGFHLLRVVERRGLVEQSKKVVDVKVPEQVQQLSPKEKAAMQEGPVNVKETHARHILVAITPVVSEQEAHEKIMKISDKLKAGESFDSLAKQYSDDTSAVAGGDLNWLTEGTMDPAFEAAMNALSPNQVSQPVKSAFGWHIIEVLDRRTVDKQSDIRKELALDTLQQQQAEQIFANWIQQLRAQSYIDNRLIGSKKAQ